MASPVQLTGGAFQDSMGNILVDGYLMMKLSSDEEVNDSLICSGIEIRIQLDASGNVVTSPAQSVWGNDVMLPVNSYYTVTGYAADGQVAWGPNGQQVIGTGTFDTGTWIPNQVISWVPPLQVPTLEVNGVPTILQNLQNLVDSATVTFANIGGGEIQTTAIIPPPAPLSLPQPDVALFSYWSAVPGGTTGWTPIFDNLSYGGPYSQVPATATAAATVVAGINGVGWIGNPFVWPTRLTTFKSTANITATGTTAFRFWGLTNAVGVDSSGPVNPIIADCIGIEVLETALGLGNWLIATSIAGTYTLTDTGVPIVSGTRYNIGFTVNAGVVTLYLNGVESGTASVNIPTTNALFMAYCQQRTAGSVDITTSIEYLYTSNAAV